ncbi:amino acid permease [Weissella diestrammenae]|uniref:Amino acid permease n=1 Tax=Weissella diestrammenae TaxID=1162633 RepID=A0A7G9T756_9LACO|nr:amino acid permease [Weissella diestrammenae]MCM0582468.1 amino acid permease [Weissella diestrammenae]QNN75931.1 amino acid permease [Weissella diestrammenae]
MKLFQRIFKQESREVYMQSDSHFAKTLGAKDLLSLGVGTVIGTGIFILPGTVAATQAGPAIVLSFIIAAIIAALVAMAYSEFASVLPVAGSAYSFGNVVFGEIIGWILGWALILEYFLAVAAVSTGWAAYFANFISPIFKIPTALSGPFDPAHGTYINLFAVLIVLLIAAMLWGGMRESKRIQNFMVALKIIIIIFFIIVGLFFIKTSNYTPFIPARLHGAFGWHGVFTGTTMVFFAFLGFDSLALAAAEVKQPQRNLPIGIIGTLIISTILYAGMAFVMTGMVNYTKLNVADPAAFVFQSVGAHWASLIITLGALIGMFTMMYASLFGSSRLLYSMGRDGLLPKVGRLNQKSDQPTTALVIATIIIAIFAGLIPLNQLVELVNFGTILAFLVISFGIIPLRRRATTDLPNSGFKMPGYPILPIISVLFLLFLVTQLQNVTLIFGGIWFLIGLVVYFAYGIRHSKMSD